MTQPTFVPTVEADQVRPARRLRSPGIWTASRPSEQRGPVHPTGSAFGNPGPDGGYALKLARRLAEDVDLAPGEHADDLIAGCAAVAMRRASLFGRAPTVFDLRLAFVLWGCSPGAPADLVAERVAAFRSVSHDYPERRAIADRVPEATLRLTPEEAAERLPDWRELLGLEGATLGGSSGEAP